MLRCVNKHEDFVPALIRKRVYTYRVIHDVWTLLQQMISCIFMIGRLRISVGPVRGNYGLIVLCYVMAAEMLGDPTRRKYRDLILFWGSLLIVMRSETYMHAVCV